MWASELIQVERSARRKLGTMHGIFESVRELSMDKLVVSTNQARIRDVERDLDELVQNIRTHGQIEPIVVAPVPGEDKYEIVTGQRRYLAHRRLGRDTIVAAILQERVDEVTAKAISISENIIRKDLNPNDLIDACTALYRKYGSVKAVAEEVGLPYHRVLAYVKYERLRPELKQLVSESAVDLHSALHTEDVLAERDEGSVDPVALAQTLASMTRAQQASFLKDAKNGKLGELVSSTTKAAEMESVTQVIITLSTPLHATLKEWARRNGMTQDRAARQILERFFDEAAATDDADAAVTSDGSRAVLRRNGRG
jgi:ParB family chromosome partitioning protein